MHEKGAKGSMDRMDALQFGHWFSQRRRAAGWRSQQSLVATAQHGPVIAGHALSEDFIARLEAGRLRRPFRGSVRARVLALAWLLCSTRRELDAYVAAAGLSPLSASESADIERLRERLRPPGAAAPLVLPPRPLRLVGQDVLLDELVRQLRTGSSGLYAITGTVGSGKSALAAEALHRVSSSRTPAFRDGIVAITTTAWQGERGFLSLLRTLNHFYPSSCVSGSLRAEPQSAEYPNDCRDDDSDESPDEGDVTRATNLVRAALSTKEFLLLLDDLDPRFPLRRALDMLLASGQAPQGGERHAPLLAPRRVILVTSRAVPPPTLTVYHHHMQPLDEPTAVMLLSSIIGHAGHDLFRSSRAERAHMVRICRAVGGLPLGIEAAAAAIQSGAIPLSLLAERPASLLLSGDDELKARLTRSLEAVGPEAERRLSLLSLLGSGTFDLAPAASLTAPVPASGNLSTRANSPRRLAATAIELGRLARHSLLEVKAPVTTAVAPSCAEPSSAEPSSYLPIELANQDDSPPGASSPRYRLHPLLRALAQERVQQVDPEVLDVARGNLHTYALIFFERYAASPDSIVRERGVLLAALHDAWQTREHATVLRLAQGLVGMEGRMGGYVQAIRVLRLGLWASRHEKDAHAAGHFLNRLGRLLLYHGEFEQARHAWDESLHLAEASGRRTALWHPLGNLALLAASSGDHVTARAYADAYHTRVEHEGDAELVGVSLSRRGMCACVRGDADAAYDDLSASLHLLADASPIISPFRRAMEAELRLGLACLKGSYPEAQQLFPHAAHHAQDPYAHADLLCSQAWYAYDHEAIDDARQLARRAADLARKISAAMLYSQSVSLLRMLN